jgi:hypothetical protein
VITRRHLCSAVLAAAVAATCSTPATPAVSRAPDAATATAQRDGVRVTLTLEGEPVTGAISWARVHVVNLAAEPARWGSDGCDLPARVTLDLGAAFASGRQWPGLLGRFKNLALKSGAEAPTTAWYIEEALYARSLHEEAVLCTAGLAIHELAPGDSLDMRAAWDGKISGWAAPVGPAVVEASFPFVGLKGDLAESDVEIRPISVRLETRVAGSATGIQLSPAVAIDAALADPGFAAFVQAAPEDTWEGEGVSVIEGRWWVSLARYGAGDRSVVVGESVIVDQTGRVVGHRSE